MEEDSVRVIAWDCIKKFKDQFKEDVCDAKHKEVDQMKDDMRCVKGKVGKIYIVLIVALLALVGNLIVTGIDSKNEQFELLAAEIQKIDQKIEMKINGP